MSNYYEKRDAKVNIAHALMDLGWKVYGYKQDESDSMTDYYSPANWGGIATKNDFILVVDNSFDSEGKDITKYNPKGHLSFEDQEKIKKLEQMTQARGATLGEEENAKILIEKLQAKISDQSQHIVIGHIPAYMANPGKCKWHIEKNGKIYDKGTGITKYADMPKNWEFDINKMEYTENHKYYYDYEWIDGERQSKRIERKLSEEQKKVINDFKNLLLRFERVVNNMNTMGDGTAETEKEGLGQQEKEGYEKITVKETKIRLKMVEVERKNIQVGDYLTFNYHGGYWKVVDGYMKKGTWKGVQMEKNAFVYEIVGKESRGYQQLKNAKRYYSYEEKMLKEVENGTIKIYELKEVEVIEEVEKWVKINKTQKTYTSKENTEQQEQTQQKEINNILNYEITITADIDTRDNSSLWVVKIVDKLNKEEYKKVSEQLKELNGYYSRFKHGFIFKYDPTNILKGEQKQQEEQSTEEVTEQVIKQEAEITPEQEIAENIIDMSTRFITELNIDGSTICNNEEYKTKLFDYIKDNNINITDDLINYLKIEEGYKNLIDILELIKVGYWQPIKDGFMYSCHFKQWNTPMEQIQESTILMNIPFRDMGGKIGFTYITAEQARQVKNISDINGSILFIDSEIPEIINIDIDEVTEQQKEPEEVNNNFDEDILSKFDDLEIENTDRIPQEDKEFCEEQENIYNKLVDIHNKFSLELQEIEPLVSEHGKKYGEQSTYFYEKKTAYSQSNKPNNIKKTIVKMKEEFIDQVCRYFANKYKVTIKEQDICKKYNDINITYNNIIDEIFIQLDGFTFGEKAVKEIKDASRKLFKDRNYQKITIKNNKIIITDFFYIDSWDVKYGTYKVSYNSKDEFYTLFKALSHFEQGTTENSYHGIMHKIYNCKDDEVFCEHGMMCFKAESIKLFKNGKIQIKFLSNEYAQQFANEYCGYLEKVA